MDTVEQLRKDLEILMEQCEEEEKLKSQMTLAKLDADDLQREAENEVNSLLKELDETEATLSEKETLYNREMENLRKEREELMRNIKELDCKMQECVKSCEMIRNELQVDNRLPPKNINFTAEESGLENLSDISYTCEILIQNPFTLRGGKALLTFEDEKVAQRIIERVRHNVDFSGHREEVKAYGVELGRTVKFEVNMTMSATKVKVVNLPTDLPEDILKDKLELAFYKSHIGGGEIESVEYNRENNSACITYKEGGVALRVLKASQHVITAGRARYEVIIAPVVEDQLNKLQIFSGICQRTVQLSEIKNKTDSEDDIKDLLEIHFMKESSGGGEVECIAFSQQNKVAHFEEDTA